MNDREGRLLLVISQNSVPVITKCYMEDDKLSRIKKIIIIDFVLIELY